MNFTIPELADLPFPAATFDADNELIAATPEWRGALPGAVTYPVRKNNLVVATSTANPQCASILGRLLDAMDNTTKVVSEVQALRVRMLAASLRILAGRHVYTQGTTQDVIAYAQAGITARTSLQIKVEQQNNLRVKAPEVAALVLVQFAANAERHARASAITISQNHNSFNVSWTGNSDMRDLTTARQRNSRERWGMGFARIAADTLGGAVYPPYDRGDGVVTSTLEVGLGRLALPIAAIANNRILKATRSWDEETSRFQGREITSNEKLNTLLKETVSNPGKIVVYDGWWARRVQDVIWAAIPPDGIMDRAHDVVDGIVHERALWDGVPEPSQSTVFALASLLGSLIGIELPRVPCDTWNRKFPELASIFGVQTSLPHFEGLSAADPRVVAYLAAEYGSALEVAGDDLFLRVRNDKLNDPFIQAFLRPGDDLLKLS